MVESNFTVHLNPSQSPIWQDKSPLLSHLDLELTERCNNACQHCYINLPEHDPQAQSRELSTADWQGILRQAAELGALSVRFSGGEPLLREDFSEIYLFARRQGLCVTLFTNARLLTPELAALLQRYPPRQKIEITVYGMSSQSYDAAACCPGAYPEFKRGVELLLEYQIPFIVKYALLPPNRHELAEFEAWAWRLPWTTDPPGITQNFYLRARRDADNRNRLIEKLRASPEQTLQLSLRREADYRKDQVEFCTKFMGASGPQLFGCGAGQGGSVDAYGRYQPCMLLRDPALSFDLRQAGASIQPGTLRQALEQFFPQALQVQATNPEYLERCAVCFIHGLCEQCPAHSWSEHGTLDTPVEYLCGLAHAQAVYLGLLQPGEQAWLVQDGRERIARLRSKE